MNETDKRVLEEFDERFPITDFLNGYESSVFDPEIIEFRANIISFLLEKLHEARAVGRGEAVELLPVIEVMRDEKKGAFALRYNMGKEYVATMLIDQSISEQSAFDVVCKVVAAANRSYKQLAESLEAARAPKP